MSIQKTCLRSTMMATLLASAIAPTGVSGCSSAGESTGHGAAHAGALGQAVTIVDTVWKVTFKTSRNTYLGADNNGGGAVVATASAPAAWESFDLVDKNGGSLMSGDEVYVRTGGGQYFQAANGGGGALTAAALTPQGWETFRIVKASGTGAITSKDAVGLQTTGTGSWVSPQTGGGGPVFAFGPSLGAWEKLEIGIVSAPPPVDDALGVTPELGPNVLVFDPSMSMSAIQRKIDAIYAMQARNHWGPQRVAYLFKPGRYDLDVKLGYHMQAAGLGHSPDDVRIVGAVRSKAAMDDGNATQNFWRAAENMAVIPTEDAGINVWAVSQATSFRRMHVMGAMVLSDGGWSSGGFIADTAIDATISSGTQQQFLTRNSALSKWTGESWNMVFVGDDQAPTGAWPDKAYSVVPETPVIREKPYLTIDAGGAYAVVVPRLVKNSHGVSWQSGAAPDPSVPLSAFYVARPERDTSDTINLALARGKHLLLTPGVYRLDSSIYVSRPDTIVMGLGLATLIPQGAHAAMEVADVDGVTVTGLIFEAGRLESPTLLRVGDGSGLDHSASPTALYDIACRVGGSGPAAAQSCAMIDSDDVILDNAWMWRADHGEGVGWGANPAKNGIIVNGNDVLAYGLFVEHFQEFQTLWNGNGGRVFFYQSEFPYDPPSQEAWRHDGVNGYASYKVADKVTSHEAIGLGAYCVFNKPVVADNAIETPSAPGVSLRHMTSVWLGNDERSAVEHVINGIGEPVSKFHMRETTPF